MERCVLHSDCNSFYASVECLKRPELRSKPVAVAGDVEMRHGIILAKNQLAKRYGVQTGEPIWQALSKCPDLEVVPPVFEDYMKFSALAREIYNDYTDRVESFGLDEAWLDVTGEDGAAVAEKIRRRIKFELGITVSIGVSFNKVFAKLGSDYRKPDAITVITKHNFKDIVWPLPVTDLLCVGRATGEKLVRSGITTIGELANADRRRLRLLLGKNGEMLSLFANGLDSSPVAMYDAHQAVKSVGNSMTLPRNLTCTQDAARVLYVLGDSVGRRLREQGLFGRCVTVSMRTSELFCFTRQTVLDRPTDLTDDIVKAAVGLVRRNYDWHTPMRSIGVKVSDLTDFSNGVQIDLFTDEAHRVKLEKLQEVSDRLKDRFGNKCIQPASLLADIELTGFDPKKDNVIHPVGFY